MPQLTNIPILPFNISTETPSEVKLKSHSLTALLSQDKNLAVDLLNSNGFNINPGNISWSDDGTVKIDDQNAASKLSNFLQNDTIAALNVCGLCQVT